MRRTFAILAFVAVWVGFRVPHVAGHSALLVSDPLEGATLGDTPAAVRLVFSEKPEASLSVIRVLDTGGASYHIGRAEAVADDPLSLSIRIKPLERGVYIVDWRVVSAVDGHTNAGTYAFGVRVTPTGPQTASPAGTAQSSLFEMLARCLLIAGLVALAGAGAAGMMRFGGARELTPAFAGWLLAVLGLALLAEAQRRNAAASFAAIASTPIGRALVWRAAALAAAGAALVIVRRAARHEPPRRVAIAWTAVTLAALGAMAVHVAAGHAAAGGGMSAAAAVAAQWAHFGAAGIWIGGLAALLFGLRGSPSPAKANAVRRFSNVAAAGLAIVAATGVVRAVGALASWGELLSSGYGRVVLAKTALLAGIVAFASFNHWRSLPAAAGNLRPLHRAGSCELVLAAATLVAAALLGTLPPPADAQEPAGLAVSGADFATTVRVRLSAPSDQPGPNRFVLKASDYDTGDPVRASRVSLRFTPLDDADVAPTTLALTPGPAGTYMGSGANLAFDGRWQITALTERAGDAAEVPLEVDVRGLPQFLSILRPPGEAPTYTVEVQRLGHVRFSPNPERAGRSTLSVRYMTILFEDLPVGDVALTIAASGGPPRRLAVRRVDASRFEADVELQPGRNTFAAIARTVNGARMRATVDVNVTQIYKPSD